MSIDEPVRDYLTGLMTNRNLPRPLQRTARFGTWVTTGFLPQRFRDEMQLAWSERDQCRFDTLLRRAGAVQRCLPGMLRRFPFNLLLWDLRIRIRLGRPLA